MPITPFLGDQQFDPESTRIMGVAFELAHAAVARDWGDYADATLAKLSFEQNLPSGPEEVVTKIEKVK